MQRLELIYMPPFPIDPGSPLDYRISTITGAPADPALGVPADPEQKAVEADAYIRWFGVDPPLILGPVDDPVVIRGHRQIDRAYALGVREIPFVVYPPNFRSDYLAEMALSKRPKDLSGVEEILALVKTLIYAPRGDKTIMIPQASPPLAGVFPLWGPMAIDSMFGRSISPEYACRLSTALTWPAEDLVQLHRLSLSFENIASLIDLPNVERQAVIRIREIVRLTAGELKGLTRLLALARGRKHFELETWLGNTLDDRDAPLTGSDILKSLRNSIHPHLTEATARIEEELGEMPLSNRLRITAPENLEGGSFSCYFKFSNDGELRGHVAKLEKIIENGSAKRIIDMLDPADKDKTK